MNLICIDIFDYWYQWSVWLAESEDSELSYQFIARETHEGIKYICRQYLCVNGMMHDQML